MEYEIVTAHVKYYIKREGWDYSHNCSDGVSEYGPFYNEKSAEETLISWGFHKTAHDYYIKIRDEARILRRIEEIK